MGDCEEVRVDALWCGKLVCGHFVRERKDWVARGKGMVTSWNSVIAMLDMLGWIVAVVGMDRRRGVRGKFRCGVGWEVVDAVRGLRLWS